jgi:hypothetical protein
MKTLNLFISLLIILTINAGAQNYQTIYTYRTALFKNPVNKIIGLRIDSVKISSDTILYPFTTIQEVSVEGCFSPYKASWIGDKVVIKPDGSNLFFNRKGEPITLKTRAQLNDSWIAFHRADTFQVEATVKNVEFEEFMGLNDSVKTIAFRVAGQQNNTINHDLNNLEVKISQNYGFVETLNFYLFPDYVVHYPPDRLEKYTLTGLTNPEVGLQNLKWFDVYDFNAGDELHIQEYRTGNVPFSSIIEYDNRCIYKYLERIDYADSIVYRYARKQSIETVYSDSTSLVTFNDTVKEVIRANPPFDKLPGEPVADTLSVYSYYMRDNEFRMKIDPTYTGIFFFINENCYALPIIEGCLHENRYLAGLGGPYYSCTGYVGDTEERKLVYYRKGETEWGEKLIITNISDIKKDIKIHVYPNPATDELNVFLNSNNLIYKIELFNLTGNCIYQNCAVHEKNFKLNVSEFPKGVYILKVKTEQRGFSQQVVIQ